MKYTVTKSVIWVLGVMWMPPVPATMTLELDDYDINNLRSRREASDGNWRNAVERWLSLNSGDFQEVLDFSASLEIDDETVNLDWENPESEFQYNDLIDPDYDND